VAFPNLREAPLNNTTIQTQARACTILPNFVGYRRFPRPNGLFRLAYWNSLVTAFDSWCIMGKITSPWSLRRIWLDINLGSSRIRRRGLHIGECLFVSTSAWVDWWYCTGRLRTSNRCVPIHNIYYLDGWDICRVCFKCG